jgi:NADH-quinone oxidoreductase subunit C
VDTAEDVVVDQARTALLEGLQSGLGDALIEYALVPGVDLTVRVSPDSWSETAEYLREGQRFRFFDFLSAIDWMPSPFGRSMDAAVDADPAAASDEPGEIITGLAGGDTRFQILARVFSLTTNIGVTLKADLGDDLTIGTWTDTYAGAGWHEREVWEMFGISFAGHPGLRPLYLPTDFEGHPMRKDFPLLARLIKPWPGIVDVEPMPEAEQPVQAGEPAEAGPPAAVPDPAEQEASAQTTETPEPAVATEPVVEQAPAPAPEPKPVSEPAGEAKDTGGIPEHLLKRSREAKGDSS